MSETDPWVGVTIDLRVDLRVDRHDAPLDDLARLLDAAVAYSGYGQAVDALMGGRSDESIELLEAPMRQLPNEGLLQLPEGVDFDELVGD